MKIAIAQLNYHIGNFEGNLAKIKGYISKAILDGVDIVCFGELATCGYPPRDFLEFSDFIHQSNECIEAIREASMGIAVVIGAPSINPVPEGKDLYNSVYFIANQEILHVQHKAPAREFNIVEYKGQKIALTVCEDIWNIGNENPLYTICPLDEYESQNPDFIINVSASPFSYNHAEARLEILKANISQYGIPMFYINHVGAQTEIIFDGGSTVMSPDGTIYEEMPYFVEDYRCYDLDDVKASGQSIEQSKDKILEIHDALVLGLKDYFGKLGFKTCERESAPDAISVLLRSLSQ